MKYVMKKLEPLAWVVALLFVCLCSSCDDELIEGTFQDTLSCQDMAEIGEVRAILVDTLDLGDRLSRKLSQYKGRNSCPSKWFLPYEYLRTT